MQGEEKPLMPTPMTATGRVDTFTEDDYALAGQMTPRRVTLADSKQWPETTGVEVELIDRFCYKFALGVMPNGSLLRVRDATWLGTAIPAEAAEDQFNIYSEVQGATDSFR